MTNIYNQSKIDRDIYIANLFVGVQQVIGIGIALHNTIHLVRNVFKIIPLIMIKQVNERKLKKNKITPEIPSAGKSDDSYNDNQILNSLKAKQNEYIKKIRDGIIFSIPVVGTIYSAVKLYTYYQESKRFLKTNDSLNDQYNSKL
jgi:hypothetical protein